jgi:hypothetical protein
VSIITRITMRVGIARFSATAVACTAARLSPAM